MEGIVNSIRFVAVFLVPALLMIPYFLLFILTTTYRVHILALFGMSAVTVVLVQQGILPRSIPSDVWLFTVPALQAGIFVILSSIFRYLTGSYPLAFFEAPSYGIHPGFWAVVLPLTIVGGFVVFILIGIPVSS